MRNADAAVPATFPSGYGSVINSGKIRYKNLEPLRGAPIDAAPGSPALPLYLKHQLSICRERPHRFIHDHLQLIRRCAELFHDLHHGILIEECLFLHI